MKKLHYIIAAAALTAGLSSCNDVLDVNNTTEFSDAIIWSKSDIADGYVVAAYNTFTDYSYLWGYTRQFFDAYTDLYKSNSWDQWEHLYNKTWALTNSFGKNNAGVFGSWGGAYGRIKRTNLLINDIDRYGGKFGEDWQEIRRAEARFCNAINYWFIARVYGGAVLRTHNSGQAGLTDDGAYEADKHRARLTEEQTYDYILSEMQWAADRLPEKWEERFTGRATKGMVYGFMSRMALFAKKWDVAVDAAEKCKEYGGYSLVNDFAQLFKPDFDKANRQEVIHARYGLIKIKTHGFDAAMRPFGDGAVYDMPATAMAQIVPTAELADMYEYKDGTDFDWKTWTNKRDENGKKITDPFSYREPRFHATILYNGAQWEDRKIESFIGANASVADGVDSYVPFEIAKNCTLGHSSTGYYMRKSIHEGNKDFKLEGSWVPEIYLRYAEVLLNKAEALGELGQFKDALVPLNEVRARVGLPAKTLADVPDLEAFRKVVRRERACELAGEGHRFWDLRRWGIAAEVISQPLHGVKITRRATGALSYETVEVDDNTPRIYQDRYNYFSLPNDELVNNKLCVDNPGW